MLLRWCVFLSLLPHGQYWIFLMILMICGAFFIKFYRFVWTRMPPWRKYVVKLFNDPHHGWLKDILSAISAKHKVKCNAESTYDPGDVYHYKSIKNSLKTMIRAAKLECIRSLLTRSHHSPKFAATLWSEVKEIIGWCQSHKSSLCSDLSLESINDFFCTVVVKDDHHPAKSYLAPVTSLSSDIFNRFSPLKYYQPTWVVKHGRLYCNW